MYVASSRLILLRVQLHISCFKVLSTFLSILFELNLQPTIHPCIEYIPGSFNKYNAVHEICFSFSGGSKVDGKGMHGECLPKTRGQILALSMGRAPLEILISVCCVHRMRLILRLSLFAPFYFAFHCWENIEFYDFSFITSPGAPKFKYSSVPGGPVCKYGGFCII